MVRSSCSHTGKHGGYGYQLPLLHPPCAEEKAEARCEMVPPLLCYLMALVSCVLPSTLPSHCVILPKLPCVLGSSATTKDGTTLVACSALSSGAATLTPVALAPAVQSTRGLGAAKLTHHGSG